MKKKYNGKFNVVMFEEGDFAMLKIPSGDRTSLDDRRLAIKIIGIPKSDVYTL